MNQIKTGTVAEGLFVLEEKQRLSNSLLWQAQRHFFERQGIDAWLQRIVPHYITNNPYLANTYARLVFAFLRDCQTATPGEEGFPPLDLSQPLYIIELGSGSGRLAFHFLKNFLPLLARSALKEIPLKFVLTDFAEQTLEFWQTHRSLQPFLASGHLDIARFDAEQPKELYLRSSGEILAPNTLKNPIILLANYFFDSIPHDAFYIEAGELDEYLVTTISLEAETDFSRPDLLQQIELSYERRPATADYYEDSDFNRILNSYRQRLAKTVLLFPHVGLRCLRYFRELAGDRLLLISADKGYSREEDLNGRGDPHINLHGSFSMMVNYHAIGEYFRLHGGQVHLTSYRQANLNITAFLLGQHPRNYIETAQAFYEACESGGPDDFFHMKQGLEKHYGALTLPQLLATLRLSRWDTNLVMGCFPTLLELAEKATPAWRKELHRAAGQVWEHYYPLGEEKDLAFNLGLLLYTLDDYPEALKFFTLSLHEDNPDPRTLFNIAVCHHALNQPEAALQYLHQTLAVDPTLETAQALRLKLEAESV